MELENESGEDIHIIPEQNNLEINSVPNASNETIVSIPSQITSFFGLETVTDVLREQFIVPNSPSTPRIRQMNNRINPLPPNPVNSQNNEVPSGTDSEEDNSSEEFENNERDISTIIDLRLVLRWFENNFPYLTLLLIVFLHRHLFGISIFLWLYSILIRINHVIKEQVALKENKEPLIFLGLISALIIHIVGTYSLSSGEQLWRSLLLLRPFNIILTFWDALWIVVINDIMVRFASMIVKCLYIWASGNLSAQSRRKQLYGLIELASSMYRLILPIPVWFTFLYEGESNHTIACIMAGLYLSFKLAGIRDRLEVLFVSAKAFILQESLYGKYATQDQILEHGENCSICQDTMTSPICLACGHMFCEDCVSEWFEREKTCPMCRSVIKTAGNHIFSDGGTSLLVQLF